MATTPENRIDKDRCHKNGKNECVMLFRHINKLMWILSRSSASNAPLMNKFCLAQHKKRERKLPLESSKSRRMTIFRLGAIQQEVHTSSICSRNVDSRTSYCGKYCAWSFLVSMASPNGDQIFVPFHPHHFDRANISKHLHAWRIDNFEMHKRYTEALPTQKIHLKLHLMLFTVKYCTKYDV